MNEEGMYEEKIGWWKVESRIDKCKKRKVLKSDMKHDGDEWEEEVLQ